LPSSKSLDVKSSARALAPPLLAFLAARALLVVAALTAKFAPLDPSSYQRWDSDQYLSIARRGYYLIECARTGYLPYGWCGNTGWMPGYPALLVIVSSLTRMSLAAAGVLVSALFEIGMLSIAWQLLEKRNFLALLACAFVPGMVYHHAIFPVSMCAFFVLLTLSLLLRQSWSTAGIAGAVAAMTYSSGFLMAPVAALYSAGLPARWSLRFRRALVSGGVALGGLVAVFVLHQATVGAWDAFVRVQAKYGHGLYLPTVTWLDAVSPLWTGAAVIAPAIQAVIVAMGIVALTVWRRVTRFDARNALFLGTAGVFWLVPLVLGGINLYRADALLVPALLVLGEAPRWLNGVVCVVFATLGFFMAQLFFRGVLV